MRRAILPVLFTSLLAVANARADWMSFDATAPFPASLVPDAAHMTVLGRDETSLTIAVECPGAFETRAAVEGREMVRWTIPRGTSTAAPGLPEVPYLARLVAVNGPGARVEVLSVEETRIEGVMLAPAAKKPLRCGGGKPEKTCDQRAYGVDEFLPGSWARLDSQGVFRDVDVARLVVSPVRFNAARSEVRVASRLVLKVHLGHGPVVAKAVSPAFAAVYRAALLNWPLFREEVTHLPERVLVVAHDSLVDAVQPFVQWKREQGLIVDVTPLSDVGETANELLAHIQDVYASNSRPAYVILAGDAELVPHLKGADGCASDWMFTTLEGNDLYSDVIISRISAKTPEDVEKYVARVIYYEKTPPQGDKAAWLADATFISSSEGDGPSNDDYRSDIMAKMAKDYGYLQVDQFYHSKGNDTATNISASLDQGRGMLTYLGHGSGTSWATTVPEYSNDHIDALKNVWMHPFIMDVSCSNGGFDGYGDCMAEAWVKAGTKDAPTGGLVTYSSSTPTAWDEPAEMAIGFTEAVLSKGKHRWGEACLYSRTYLMEKMGSGENIELVFQQYVLFGDATISLRTRPPAEMNVTHPEVVPVGELEVTVTVADGAAPVADALVALRKEGEFQGSAYTDSAGNAVFQVSTATPGEMEVVVTAADRAPYFGKFVVAVTGCGVVQVTPKVQNCGGEVQISLWDKDLNADSVKAETASVVIKAEPGVEKALALAETGPDTGAFTAKLALADIAAVHGSKLTATYQDAACEGGVKEVAAVASADCVGPVISGVKFEDITVTTARVVFETDEPAEAQVYHGDAKPPASLVKGTAGLVHEAKLTSLTKETQYFVKVEAKDVAGNVTTDDKGGEYWSFTTPACLPACQGKDCGDDGCGGSCGACKNGTLCLGGLCLEPGCTEKPDPGWPGAKCEKCVCDMDPYCCQSSWDYVCVGECESSCEGCGGCTPSCKNKTCGSDGCGGSCGTCADPCTGAPDNPDLCVKYQCKTDVCCAVCEGKECGDDGCGGSCGGCSGDLVCKEGKCAVCVPDCTGIQCGSDGCKGTCGGCDEGWDCVGGKCTCEPKCDGKQCGEDGCGGSCGSCSDPCAGKPDVPGLCKEGKCETPCCPACTDKQCGDDGCGGKCGECPFGWGCDQAGKCACIPDCKDRECGPDGCAGSCGSCKEGFECGAAGTCVLKPVPEPDPEPVPETVPEPVPDSLGPDTETGRGGGGCSAGGGGAGGAIGMAISLAALLASLASRGRKTDPMAHEYV